MMHALTWTAMLATALSLQAGTGSPASARPETQASMLKVVGCLDRAPNGTYQLKNARLEPLGQPANRAGGAGTTSGATGTSGATRAARAPMTDATGTWILKSTTDLAPHVGHQITVTGRPSSLRSSADDAATTAPPTTTATGARVKEPGETSRSLDVDSVTMLARACS